MLLVWGILPSHLVIASILAIQTTQCIIIVSRMSFIDFGKSMKQIFPSRWSLCLFIAYIILFTTQGLLVKWSNVFSNNDYRPLKVSWSSLVKVVLNPPTTLM